jgi:hypothetical protein
MSDADTLFKGANTAQRWNVRFKFAPPRRFVTVARLAVARYSRVHSNGVRGLDAWKVVQDLRNVFCETKRHTPSEKVQKL